MSTTADRVLSRYAAAVLDEKMKTLLLKLRKGADASLSQGQLFKVLALLGGWRVEPIIGLVPLHYKYDGKDRKESYAEDDLDFARGKYEKLQSEVVSSLPTNPNEGQQYVMDLEPLRSWENSIAKGGKFHGATYNAWVGAPGYRFTDPHGKVFELLPSRHELGGIRGHNRKKLVIYDVMRWLKKDTGYIAQINELLGMEEHVPADQRTRDNTGTCACCFRNIKLVQKGKDQLMALHGYNRPGHGTIVGRCWGGDFEPYELSCAATQRILVKVERLIASEEKYIRSLREPSLESFNSDHGSGSPNPKTVKKSELDLSQWQYKLDNHIRQTMQGLAQAQAERDIFKWLVEKWVVRELPREGDKKPDWWEVAIKATRAERRLENLK